jgi:hypothetical protein
LNLYSILKVMAININTNSDHNIVEPQITQQFDSLRLILNDNNEESINDNRVISGLSFYILFIINCNHIYV